MMALAGISDRELRDSIYYMHLEQVGINAANQFFQIINHAKVNDLEFVDIALFTDICYVSGDEFTLDESILEFEEDKETIGFIEMDQQLHTGPIEYSDICFRLDPRLVKKIGNNSKGDIVVEAETFKFIFSPYHLKSVISQGLEIQINAMFKMYMPYTLNPTSDTLIETYKYYEIVKESYTEREGMNIPLQ